MIFDLLEDFRNSSAVLPKASPKYRLLQMIAEAIRRNSRFLFFHPTALFQTMWNLGSWYPNADCRHDWDRVWKLSDADKSLSQWLDKWRSSGATVRRSWARSLRPPKYPIGSNCAPIDTSYTPKFISVSADGQLVAYPYPAGSNWSNADGIRVMCLSTMQLVGTFRTEGEVLSVCIARASDYIVTIDNSTGSGPAAQADRANLFTKCISVWSLSSGELLLQQTLVTYDTPPTILRHLHPHKVVIKNANTIQLFDVTTGHRTPLTPPQVAFSFCISQRGSLLAYAHEDRQITLRDLETNDDCTLSVRGQPICFSPSSSLLAVRIESTTIAVADLTSRSVDILPGDGLTAPFEATFTSDDTLIVGDYRLYAWHLPSPTTKTPIEVPEVNYIRCIHAVPNSRSFLFSINNGGLYLQQMENDPGPQRFDHGDMITFVGSSLAGEEILSGSLVGDVGVWDSRSGTLRRMWKAHQDGIVLVRKCPSRHLYASLSYDDTFRIFGDSDEPLLKGSCLGVDKFETAASFSSDGKYFAVRSNGDEATLWDIEKRSSIIKFDLGYGRFASVSAMLAFAADRNILAVERRSAIEVYDGDRMLALSSLAINTNCRMLCFGVYPLLFAALVNGTAVVWDYSAGTVVRQARIHMETERAQVAVSEDLEWCAYCYGIDVVVFRTDGSVIQRVTPYEYAISSMADSLRGLVRARLETVVEPGPASRGPSTMFSLRDTPDLGAVRVVKCSGRHLEIFAAELAPLRAPTS